MPKAVPHLTTFQKKLIRWLLSGESLHGRMWERGPSYYVQSGNRRHKVYTNISVATITSLLNKNAIYVTAQSEDKISYELTEACARYCRKHLLKITDNGATD